MEKPKYVVKTYFSEDEKGLDNSDYYFMIFYRTILPSFSLLMAFQLKENWFFSLCFGLFFLFLTVMQFTVISR